MAPDRDALREIAADAMRRKEKDPYDLAAIIEALLAMSALGEQAASQVEWTILKRLKFRHPSTAALERIARCELVPVRYGTGWYLLDPAPPSPSTYNLLPVRCERTIREVFTLAGQSPQLLLVHLRDDHPRLDFSSPMADGAAYVRIARRDDISALTRILRHEATHLVLHSGCRFLDEGIAAFVERMFEGVEPPEILADLQQKLEGAQLPPLRECLARYQDALVLDDVGGRYDGLVYQQAAALAGRIVVALGWFETARLFVTLAGQDLARQIDILECVCGLSPDALGNGIVKEAAPPGIAPGDLRVRFDEARASSDRERIAQLAVEVDDRGAACDAVLRVEILSALTLSSIQCRVLPDDVHIEKLSAAIAALPLDQSLGTLRLRAQSDVEVARLMIATDPFARSIRAAKARQHLNAALAQTPGDPEASLRLAIIELFTPVEYGGDHNAAERLLSEAAMDPRLRSDVQAYRRNLEIKRSAMP